MKTNLILTVITILSLGTLAFVRAQDEAKEAPAPEESTVSGSNETTPEISGIRTDTAVEQQLMGGTSEVTAIPVGSVFTEEGRFFVLLKDAESGGAFREVEVTLGRTDGLNVEVKTGLFPGDEVVTVSVGQLRFPAFDDGSSDVCAVNACGTTACDSATATCSVKSSDGESCRVDGNCKEEGKEAADCGDGATCKSGTASADGPAYSSRVDLTISAEDFFDGGEEVNFAPGHPSIMGQPGFCPPY
ncbi:MAG: efflux RND transporter periplasmic adaptor subunit [Verrucomicrobiales bacterium]|nr:efflux RND transporter periplasmic adaptor subunit [Verrucomicrobiales bacterium]